MSMNNQEKNRYVKEQILGTLLKMMKTEKFESIVINRLVKEACVGRASFYRNYTSKEDVLHQEARRLKLELEHSRKDDDPNDIRLKLIRTLEFYKMHSDFYLTLYQAGLKQIIEDSIIDGSTNISELPNATAYAISGFSYLIYGWIIEWIKRGMKESSTELIEIYEKSQK